MDPKEKKEHIENLLQLLVGWEESIRMDMDSDTPDYKFQQAMKKGKETCMVELKKVVYGLED